MDKFRCPVDIVQVNQITLPCMKDNVSHAKETHSRGRLLVHEGLRLFLGCVFLTAAAFKLSDLQAFQASLANLGWLPLPLDRLVGLWIPGLECVLAVCLICGLSVREAGTMSVALMAVFVGIAIFEFGTGMSSHGCACFKGSEQSWFAKGIGKVVRNTGLFGIGALLLRLNATLPSTSRIASVDPQSTHSV